MTSQPFDLRPGELYVEGPEGFQPLGTVEGATFVSRDAVDTDPIPFTTKVEASWSYPIDPDDAFRARRNLARICGLPLPTTAGIDLWPDIERRAALAHIQSQKLRNRKAGAR